MDSTIFFFWTFQKYATNIEALIKMTKQVPTKQQMYPVLISNRFCSDSSISLTLTPRMFGRSIKSSCRYSVLQ